MPRPARRRAPALLLLLLPACPAAAADREPDTVVIAATRSEAPADALPLSADVVGRARLDGALLQVNLSEVLGELAGVGVQQRQNYAQDLQLTLRGFGARSSFGVRGVRLLVDGIPATMPDGQGQLSHIDLPSVGRIEVVRGPYSVLYGNAAGGVVALQTREPEEGTATSASVASGPWATTRYGVQAGQGGAQGSWLASLDRFDTNGFRQHSVARRDTLNLRVRSDFGARGELVLVGNVLDLPEAQDPLGLTRAQLAADPRQAGSNALAYDARKSLGQQQLGAHYVLALRGALRLELSAYGGRRTVRQFQAIPRAVQAAPTHPGGVIDLDRKYRGLDVRLHDVLAIDGGRVEWTMGLAADGLDEARRGFLDYSGALLGTIGELRRAEASRVVDGDGYAQLQYARGRASWLVGVRRSSVHVRTRNGLLPDAPASEVDYGATNPVAGFDWRLAGRWHAWLAQGVGYETPTLNDLAYRSTDGSLPGLNLGLRAARSHHYELGLRGASAVASGSLALFQVDTRDELAVLASAGGRTVYQNVAATRRRGAELELEAGLGTRWTGRLAATLLDARSWTGARLPAVPAGALGARVAGRFGSWSLALESQLRTRILVDDRGSDAAGGYATFNASLGREARFGAWRVAAALRVDDLLDRRYVGSVIVNEANGRYFEPAPGRAAYLQLRVAHESGR